MPERIAGVEIEAELRDAGLPVTKVRLALLKALRSCGKPVTADGLRRRLLRRAAAPGRASIYRNLEAFAVAGLVERLASEARGREYLACRHGKLQHHHYIVCERCRASLPVTACLPERAIRTVETTTAYTVTHHQLSFSGICPACRRREQR